MKTLRSNSGFTLIELMIVVVIIGILAAIAIPRFSGVSRSAKQSEAHSILKQIYTLQEAYYQRNNTYAATLPTLVGYDPPQNLKYFQPPAQTAASGGATFCAFMEPSTTTGTGLEARAIDNTKQFYAANACSGTPIDP